MSAVPVHVERVGVTVHEIVAGNDLPRKLGMGRIDARVDDRNHDVRAALGDVPGRRGRHEAQAILLSDEGVVRRPLDCAHVVRFGILNTRAARVVRGHSRRIGVRIVVHAVDVPDPDVVSGRNASLIGLLCQPRDADYLVPLA